MNVAAVEPIAATRDEDMGRDRVSEEPLASFEVVGQDSATNALSRSAAVPPIARTRASALS